MLKIKYSFKNIKHILIKILLILYILKSHKYIIVSFIINNIQYNYNTFFDHAFADWCNIIKFKFTINVNSLS